MLPRLFRQECTCAQLPKTHIVTPIANFHSESEFVDKKKKKKEVKAPGWHDPSMYKAPQYRASGHGLHILRSCTKTFSILDTQIILARYRMVT